METILWSQKRRWWGTGLSILGAVLIFAAFITRRDDSYPSVIAHVQRGQIRSLISTTEKISRSRILKPRSLTLP